MQILESEIKYQLYKQDFYRLKEYISNSYSLHNTVNQVNYYIDNKNLHLQKDGISVRIRKKDVDSFEFTIKINKNKTDSNIHIKDEYTTKLESDIAKDLIKTNNVPSLIQISKIKSEFIKNVFNFNDLIILGHLNTFRTNYKFKDNIFFTLDINTYLGITDYELEVEGTPDNIIGLNNELSTIFLKLNIEPISNFDSKSKRFKNKYKLSY